jgi:flavin reductase (DIM6/NTAB) family NADH-FMN oxidoreductase RutF
MSVDPALFKAAMGRFGSGVTVVTARGAEGDLGLTASSFTSLSLDPQLVLVCVRKAAASHAGLLSAAGFCVHLLAEEQVELSNRFAGRWPEGRSRFEGLEEGRAPYSGAPSLPLGLGWVDCGLHAVHDGGDHSIFVGRVEAIGLSEVADRSQLRPLLYFAGAYRSVGSAL